MPVVAKLDELGKSAWIALMVLGFFAYWPLGLAVLGFMVWSGRMGSWRNGGLARFKCGGAARSAAPGTWWQPSSSGNRAFDEYRADTISRLEDEQREFKDFLERLRMAKDKQEFDQFMADRRNRSDVTPVQA